MSNKREFIALIVYISLLLDNMLLTVIVPILPDYLAGFSDNYSVPETIIYKNFDLHYVPGILSKHPLTGNSLVNYTINSNEERFKDKKLEDENGSVGILLAVKAVVQLIFNPIVGNITNCLGYRIPIVFGTFCVLVASLIFGIGESYGTLFFARALQGIGSACIGVCGMSLVAQSYPEEDKRSKIMGIVLGSIALGVLLGYPFGGILYDFVGKSAPFFIIAALLFMNIALQLFCLELNVETETILDENENMKWWPLLSDQTIFLVACAIWISTSAMAVLEPCLPIWLISNLHPKKWQLGTVFIPDSIGYLLGTNFFGSIAYKVGQLKLSVLAMILVGISCIVIPNATSVISLLLPHFGLGLGIGVLDASLVPLLATLVDSRYSSDDESSSSGTFSNYGAVYAIQQTAVSLAYSVAPLVGGELAQTIGFPCLMRIIGLINLLYGPFFLMMTIKSNMKGHVVKNTEVLLNGVEINNSNNYKKFYNSID